MGARIPPPIGKIFGSLTVVGSSITDQGKVNGWLCRCVCGAEVRRQASNLNNGLYLSCRRCSGAAIKRLGQNLVGKVFGRLTVISRSVSESGETVWNCSCSCGGARTASTYHLAHIQLPGCSSCEGDRRTISLSQHGGSARGGTRIWRIWRMMLERCGNPKNKSFHNYGGKGISVCSEWNDFVRFREWANTHGYAYGLSIDRVDSNKGYCPENCEWVTISENSKRMWAKVSPNNRRIEGFKRQVTRRANEEKLALVRSMSLNQHLPIEFMWGT